MRPHSGFLTALPAALTLLGAWPASAQRSAAEPKIDSILARMTVEEKLGQLNQLSVDNQPTPEQLALVRKGLVGSFLNLTGAAATREAQHIAVTESRLHIPLIFGQDVIHGYRTIFPIPLGESASWDPEAVEAAATVMTSFNEIGGIPSTASPWLMTTLLRREWGFRGFVVSDYTAVAELRNHGVADSRAEAGKLALEAGVDMDMVSRIYVDELPALVRAGRIPEAVVNEAVRRVLRGKAALGLFDDPYHGASPERERSVLLAPEHRQLARRVAEESIVLLKNDGQLLPLGSRVRTVAVIGPLADDKVAALGSWPGRGDPRDAVTPLEGIKQRAGGVSIVYAKGCGITDTASAGFVDAVAAAKQADIAMLVLGEAGDMSGEAASRANLDAPRVQPRVLEAT